MFVLEEYNKEMNELIQRRYISKMVSCVALMFISLFASVLVVVVSCA